MKRIILITLSSLFLFGLWNSDELFAQTKQQLSNRLRLAQEYERRGSYGSALRIYKNLYDQVPGNFQYYEGVKRNMIRLSLFDELIDLLNQKIKQTDDIRYWADLGNVYYQKGSRAEAEQIWSRLLAEHGSNQAIYQIVARAMIENRLYDEAIQVYQQGRANLKRDDLFVFDVANIYVARLNYEKATLEYLRLLENEPRQFTYIEGRIASYTNDPDDAGKVADVIQQYLGQTHQRYFVRKLLANLYLRMRDFGKGIEQYQLLEDMDNPLDNRNKIPGQEIFKFAELALNAGEYNYAVKAYELILAKYQDSPFRIRAYYGLAVANQEQHLSKEALASYDDLIDMAPHSQWAQEALFQKGEIYFDDLSAIDQALETYKDLIERFPKSNKRIAAYFRIGDCYAARGDIKEARKWYEKPLDENVANATIREKAIYHSAYMDFVEAKFDACLEKLNKITENLNEPPGADESYKNDALELIFLVQENKETDPEALTSYAEAQRFKLERDYADAIKKLQSILEEFPGAGILDETLLDLGQTEEMRGNHTTAIDYLQGLLKENPESIYNALAQKRIGEIYESGLGDMKQALEAYELVLTNYPNSLYIEEVRQKIRALQSRELSN